MKTSSLLLTATDDIDEGWGVYPTDVRDSGYTVSYKWF